MRVMTKAPLPDLQQALNTRYSDAPRLPDTVDTSSVLESMINRGSCRSYQDKPVPSELLTALCAIALASPTKSDLQQRDIILLQSPEKRAQLAQLVSGQTWVAHAPMLAVFCGNNRRQRLLHQWQDVPFANDHLDALVNATADAAIALGAFVVAAEASGLGCCPISAVRNNAQAVSELLDLPPHVFPFAGLAIGYPHTDPTISKRLPMRATCHVDKYVEHDLQEVVKTYDADRAATQDYTTQRFTATFGQKDNYGWSDDKVRQYSQPERADFGDYIRAQGFCLD